MLQLITSRQTGHSLTLTEGENLRIQVPGGDAGERVPMDLAEELRRDTEESDRANLAATGSSG